MSPFVSTSDLSFDTDVLAVKGDVLVEFGAPWCGPCRVLHQVLGALASERPALRIAVVDVDESPALATRYGVRGTPTLMLFRDGKPHASRVGAAAKEKIASWLDG